MTPTLAAWLHTIDPYAVKLWDDGPIRWYGLSYFAGFFLAYLLIRRVARVGISTLDYRKAGDLVVTLAVGAVVGGRLGYVLFYKPNLLIEFTDTLPYWGVLDMMGGGMSSHGGMLGGIAAAWWFAKHNKQSWVHLLDLIGFSAPLGLLCGRLANFVNGELYGKVCKPDFPLAVKFPQEIYDWLPGKANNWSSAEAAEKLTPVVESIGVDPNVWLASLVDYPSPDDNVGQPARDFVFHTLNRVMEIVQGDSAAAQRVGEALSAVVSPRHPSQLYAGALEGVVVFAVVALIWIKPRRAGTAAGAFCITYAVMRIINEIFRLPDAHLGEQPLGLSRGQWLSIPLFLLGVFVIAFGWWRKAKPAGGWRRGPWTATLRNSDDA